MLGILDVAALDKNLVVDLVLGTKFPSVVRFTSSKFISTFLGSCSCYRFIIVVPKDMQIIFQV